MMHLNTWFDLFGFHPWHRWQLADSAKLPITSACNTLIYEYGWQAADRAGRADIRSAIQQADDLITRWSRIPPSPRWIEEEVPVPRPGTAAVWTPATDVTGRWLAVPTSYGHILALGPQADTTPVVAGITYQDNDSDGIFETGLILASVPSGTIASEVVVRFGSADSPQERTIPVTSCQIVGTMATITVPAVACVRPILYGTATAGGLAALSMPPVAGSPYAGSVEVLRRRSTVSGTTNNTAMAVLTWETRPWPAWACCSDEADPAATATALARAVIRDRRAGLIAVGEAVYDATSGTWSHPCHWSHCRPPDRITLRYQAGIADGSWDQVTAHLAAAILDRGICACQHANRDLYYWQKDLAQTGASDDLYASPADLTNPLGTRRGHLSAWRHIQQFQRLAGIAA